MERFIQLVVDGIAIGSIYGALALALVLIFRSTGIVNFAQGEMAMFSTFVAWAFVQAGLPLGLAMLSGLNVLAPLGYVTACLIFGRWFVKGTSNRARIGAFFAGFGILRLLALVPGLGLLVWFVVCIYGIGAVSMAAWYGGHEVRPRGDLGDEPPAPEPVGAPVT